MGEPLIIPVYRAMSATKRSVILPESRDAFNQVFDSVINKSEELRTRGYADALARSRSPNTLNLTSRSQLPSGQVTDLIRRNASKDMKSINYDVKFKDPKETATAGFGTTLSNTWKSTGSNRTPTKNSASEQTYEEYLQSKVQAHLERIRTSEKKRNEAAEEEEEERQSNRQNDIHISEALVEETGGAEGQNIEHSFGADGPVEDSGDQPDLGTPLALPKAPKTSMINTTNLSKNSYIQTKYNALMQTPARIRKETLKFAAERIDPPQVLLDALDAVFALLLGTFAPVDGTFFALDRKKYYHYKPLLKHTGNLHQALSALVQNPELARPNAALARKQLAKYHKSERQLSAEKQYAEHVRELTAFVEWVLSVVDVLV